MWSLILILSALNYAQLCRFSRLEIEIRKLRASVTALIVERSNTVFYRSNRPTFEQNAEALRIVMQYTNEKPTTKH